MYLLCAVLLLALTGTANSQGVSFSGSCEFSSDGSSAVYTWMTIPTLAGISYTCGLNDGVEEACISPFVVPRAELKEDAANTLTVNVLFSGFLVSTFKLECQGRPAPPQRLNVSGESQLVGSNVVFTWTVDPQMNGLSYKCRLNDGDEENCVPPFSVALSDLQEGDNTLTVTVLLNNTVVTMANVVYTNTVEEGEVAVTYKVMFNNEAGIAIVTWMADVDGVSFRCALNSGDEFSCASPLNISLDQLVEGENTLELTVLLESEVVKTVQIQIQKDSGSTLGEFSGQAEVDQAGNVVVFTWMVEGTDRISYTCSINDEEEFNCSSPHNVSLNEYELSGLRLVVTALFGGQKLGVFTLAPPVEAVVSIQASLRADYAASAYLLTWTSTPSDVEFRCSLNNVDLGLCSSPFSLANSQLQLGLNNFSISPVVGGRVQKGIVVQMQKIVVTGFDVSSGLYDVCFTWNSTVSGAEFLCSINNGTEQSCSSPLCVDHSTLLEGANTMVISSLLNGRQVALRTITFVRPPLTPPPVFTVRGTFTEDGFFTSTWTADRPEVAVGYTFTCNLNDEDIGLCGSPLKLECSRFRPGANKLTITPIDPRGNVGFPFLVNLFIPGGDPCTETRLVTDLGMRQLADGDYVARWSSTFPGAVYKCSLNGAPAVDCSSPYVLNFQSLLNGWNSLSIKAFSGDRQIGATLSGTSVLKVPVSFVVDVSQDFATYGYSIVWSINQNFPTRCFLNGKEISCDSPISISDSQLNFGENSFVIATYLAGRVVSTFQQTLIRTVVRDISFSASGTSLIFQWRSAILGATFKCSLNGARDEDCSGRFVIPFRRLRPGANSMTVTAFVGNGTISKQVVKLPTLPIGNPIGVRFEHALYNTSEGQFVVLVRLVSDRPFPVSGSIRIMPMELDLVSARGRTSLLSPGVDFLRFTRSATFRTNGTISDFVPIVIRDDGIPEDFESFKVVIESIPGALYKVIEPSTAIVRIADNDAVGVNFKQIEYVVSEDGGSVSVCVVASHPFPLATDVAISLSSTNANNGSDFVFYVPTVVEFSAGDVESCVNIVIIDDDVPELSESFNLRILDGGYTIGDRGSADVEITDNDVVGVNFKQIEYVVSEDGGSVSVCVVASHPFPLATDVGISLSSTNANNGSDFVFYVPTVVEFSAGDVESCVNIVIIDDDVPELSESFNLRILDGGYTIGDRGSADIEITDNDVVGVNFKQIEYVISEDGGSVSVCVVASHPFPLAMDVGISLSSTNANNGSDLVFHVPTVVKFSAGDVESCVNIVIIDDDVPELSESLNLRILDGGYTIGDRGSADVEITDNDVVGVNFKQIEYVVSEDGGSVSVCVVASHPFPLATDVGISLSSTNANNGSDFVFYVPTVVEFSAGDVESCVNIVIIEDDVPELSESFNLRILDGGYTIGDRGSADVEITDNDAVGVNFKQIEYVVSEDGGSVSVCVVASHPFPLATDVGISLSSTNANNGSDLVFHVPTVVKFSAGDVESCVNIVIIDDDVPELSESFNLRILDGGYTIGDRGSADVEITDNDVVVVNFKQIEYVVSEDGGSVSVCAVASHPFPLAMDVGISLSSTNANNGSDFVFYVPTVVEFSAGDIESCVNIMIIDDDVPELSESFNLRILDGGYTIGDRGSADVEITDNDVVGVNFKQIEYVVSEDGGSVSVCVVASHPFPLATDVGISLSSTNANNGSDFVFYVPTVVEFSAGDVESCVNIVIIDDDVPELSESFNLRILDGGYTIGDRGSADVEITDNDVVGVNFKQIEYVISEDGGSVSVCVVASHPFPLATDVGISLSSTNANNGSDFVFHIPTVVEFSAGDVESCVNIVIIDDDVPELSESFNLRILDGGYTIGDRGSADVEITDNDVVGVNFKQIEYVVSEDGGSVSVCVVASHPFPLATDVGISLSSTNANNGSDFVFHVPTVVEFSAGDVESCVNIVIIDDDVPELSESFNLRILDGGYTIGDRGSADVEITDNDVVGVNFKQIEYVVSEDGGSVSVCVVASHPFPLATDMGISLSSTNANNGSDFVFHVPTVVEFSAGDVESCVNIVIIDDDVPELSESFNLRILDGGYTIGDRGSADVEITDNDVVVVNFKQIEYVVSEDGGSVSVCVVASHPFPLATDVGISLSSTNANNGSDFVFYVPTVVEFSAGDVESCVNIVIIDDDVPELSKSFNLRILDGGYTIGDRGSADVEITDNDVVGVNFKQIEYVVSEDGGSVSVCVVASHPFPLATDVGISLSSTNANNRSDFVFYVPTVVEFSAGDVESCVNIVIIDDDVPELSESFNLRILDGGYTIGDRGSADVEITDNDVVGVNFKQIQYVVSEDGGSVSVCVVASHPFPLATDVGINLSSTNANNGSDFVFSVPTVVEFSAGDVESCVNIVIIDDDVPELNESFNLRILDGGYTIGDRGSADVEITDNDVVGVNFKQIEYVVSEDGGSVSVCVVASHPFPLATDVGISLSSTNANNGSDFVFHVPTVVEFSVGDVESCVNIVIIDDDVPELSESFNLRILDGGYTIGDRGSADVEITDNDVVGVNFKQIEYVVSEDGGSVSVCVVASHPFPLATDVGISLSSTNANNGSDFVFYVPTVVEFSAGDIESCVNIVIIDDDVPELSESFNIRILDGGYTIGDRGSADVEITDNDVVVVNFKQIEYVVSEDGGSVSVCVVASHPFPLATDVGISLSSTNANNGSDFVFYVPSVVEFSAGDVESCVNIVIIDDDVPELSESFNLRMLDGGYTIGVRGSADVEITDNDVVGVNFKQIEYVVSEDGGSVSVCVVASHPFPLATDVGISLSRTNANNGSDFVFYVPTVVEFSAGDVESCVNIVIIDDDVPELSESFNLRILDGGYTIGDRGSADVEITDNDVVGVNFKQIEYVVSEDGGSVSVCVVASHPFPLATDVGISLSSTNANNGSDFVFYVPTVVEFSAGDVESCVNIVIIDDDVPELSESFNLRILDGRYTIGDRGSADVEITDNDVVGVNFKQIEYMVSEDGGSVSVCVVASHPFPLATDVGISLSSTNANNGSDFVFYVPTVVEFSAGDVESCVNIVIIDDDVPELSESFNLRILDGGYTIGDRGSADVEITDNDVVGVNFKQIEYVVSEDGGSVSVCAVASHPFPLATDVGISLSSTTANNRSDFVFYVPTVVEFSAGDVESCVNIVIIDDDVPELSESFNLRILDGGYTIGDRGSADVEITDNDVVGVNFKQIEYVVSEDGGSVSVCVVASHTFPLATDVGISLSSTNANNGSDFVFHVPTVVEFSAGDMESCVNIVIIDDDVPELSESFNLRILDGGYTIGDRGSADVEITDNDVVGVNFKQIEYVVSEDGGSVSVCVVASHPFPLATDVGISLSSTNANNGSDFVFYVPTVVEFSAGDVESCVNIVIIDDDVPELSESFNIRILDGGYTIGDRGSADVEITDNDVVGVNFKQIEYVISEDGGSVSVCVVASHPFPLATDVGISLSSTNANNGSDFVFYVPTVVEFSAGDVESCVNIVIVDDDVPELSESFNLRILDGGYTIGDRGSADVEITDNDVVGVNFKQIEYVISEDGGSVSVCVVASHPFPLATDVGISLSSTSANNGSDFVFHVPTVVEFSAGDVESCVNIVIIDNDVPELSESFNLRILDGGYTIGDRGSADVEITDNDVVGVNFKQIEYVVSEDGGSVSVCAVASHPFPLATDVGISLSSTTANNRSDFVFYVPTVVEFSAGDVESCVNIVIIDDDVPELSESFNLRILDGGYTIGERGSADVEITDNDVVGVNFKQIEYVVSEDGGSVSVCVVASHTFPLATDVGISLSSTNANNGSDFVFHVPTVVEFSAGDMESCVNIVIIDDDVPELSESFNLRILDGGYTIGDRGSADVEITDNDVVGVNFKQIEYVVSEDGGSVSVCVVASHPFPLATDVGISLSSTNANNGSDFVFYVPTVVEFSAGDVESCVNIVIIDDDVPELSESFNIRILDGGYTIGDRGSADVEITDNDVVGVNFKQIEYVISEDGGSVSVCVVASHPFPLATDVGISLSSTNANNGSDFVFYVPTVVEFSAGDVESCVNIVIVDDDVPELSESFNLRILDGGYTIGDRGSADVEITDNDVVGVNFKQIEYVVSEDGGSVSVCVVASHPFPLATDVGISLSSTNTNNGSDFVFHVPTVVEFSVGDVESCVNIVIIDDDVPELSESFNLRILDGGYTIGDRGSADVEITDNDVVGVNFKQIQYVVSEDGGSVSVCVVASHPFPLATDVGISLSSTNANNGSDFVFYVPTVVEFSAGDIESCVNIVIIDDDVPELSESFNIRILDEGYTIGDRGSADVEITDNDVVGVNFKQIEYVVSEDGGSVSVCVVASHPFPLATDVGISLSSTNANNGSDFVFYVPTVVEFSAGDVESCVNIVIIDDDVPELSESFNIRILDGGYTIGDRGSADVEITDNDVVGVNFKQIEYVVSEDGGSVSVCVVASHPFPLATDVGINLSSTNANNGSDFVFHVPTVVEFSAGDVESCVNIVIIDDDVPELSESFNLRILDGGYTIGDRGSADVEITDNDVVGVNFKQIEYVVSEDGGSVSVCVVASHPFPLATDVGISLSSTNANNGSDFVFYVPTVVKFSAGDIESCVNIVIIDDDVPELSESFNIRILDGGYTIGDRGSADVEITDNDVVGVNFKQIEYVVSEDGGSVSVCVVASHPFPLATDVGISLSSTNANNGSDFVFYVPTVVEFSAGDVESCVNIVIIDDDVPELSESFNLRILDGGYTIGDRGSADVEITDNDVVGVNFKQIEYVVSEDGGSVSVCVVASHPFPLATDVAISLSSTNANNGSDFVFYVPTVVEFSAGDIESCVNIVIIDDDVPELSESFNIRILDGGYTIGERGSADVEITDNDVVGVNLKQIEYVVSEDGGSVSVCVVASHPFPLATDVGISLSSTNANNGSDFVFHVPTVVEFSAGDIESCVNIVIIDDDVPELSESFNLRILDGGYTIGDRGSADVEITDNDAVSVNFKKIRFEVPEDGGSVSVCVVASHPFPIATDVGIRLSSTNANNGSDFVFYVPTVVEFSAGDVESCVNIEIVDDMVPELRERLRLHILDGSYTIGDRGVARIDITDKDAVVVNFKQIDYVVSEDGGSVSVCVVASHPFPLATDVGISLSSTNANNGSDFVFYVPTVVEFSAGDVESCVNIVIIDDDVPELSESFNLRILDGGYTIGDRGSADVEITDNDVVVVNFKQIEYVVSEDGGSVSVCVLASHPFPLATDVGISLSSTNANNGSDFVFYVPTVVEFSAGDVESCVNIVIIDDDVPELSESFNLRILDGGYTIGDRGSADVEITDNDVVGVNFKQIEYVVSEDGGSVSVCVVASHPFPLATDVGISLSSTNANNGSDFVFYVPTVVEFSAGDVESCVNIVIIDDDVPELSESFNLRILDGGYTIGDRGSADVEITDNDVVGVNFKQIEYVVSEDGGSVSVCVVASHPFPLATDVGISLSSTNANNGSDFVFYVPTVVEFSAGDVESCVNIVIIDDDVPELSESFNLRILDGGYTIGDRGSADVKITDNDVVGVNFKQIEYVVSEDGGSVSVCVVASHPFPLATDVGISLSSTNANNGSDFVFYVPTVVEFSAGDVESCVNIVIIDDDVPELSESFNLRILDGGYTIGDRGSADVKITDNDVVGVNFKQIEYVVSEDGGSVSVCVVASHPFPLATDVGISLSSSNANNGSDFVFYVPTVVEFSAGDVESCVNIVIINDDVPELSESFNLRILDGGYTIGDRGSADVEITDNDVVGVNFKQIEYVVSEDGGSVSVCVVASHPFPLATDVGISLSSTNANNGSDFVFYVPTVVEFSAGDVESCVNIVIIDDDVPELSESFNLRILDGRYTIGDRGSANVEITDNDVVVVNFKQIEYVVSEDGGSVSVCVVASHPFPLATEVGISLSSTNANNGSDFVFHVPTVVEFSAGDVESCVNIVIINDDVPELSESFNLRILDGGYTIGDRGSADVEITDNDVVGVNFKQIEYVVSEDGGSVSVCVVASHPFPLATDVGISLSSTNANNGSDFVFYVPTVVEFSAGDVESCVNIVIIDDDVPELSESFNLRILDGGYTIGDRGSADVKITDNDVVGVNFKQIEYVVSEDGGSVSVCVVASHPFPLATDVGISLSSTNANNGSDFVFYVPTVVEFSAGDVESCVNIVIIDDDVPELSESFNLRILDGGYTIGDRGSADVEITDNDVVGVNFKQIEYVVSEDGGSVSVCVVASHPFPLATDVGISLSSTNANNGSDFVFYVPTVVEFSAGDVESCVNIVIIDDDVPELSESFNLRILDGRYTIGDRGSANVEITDNDVVVVNFKQIEYVVSEDGGSVSVCVVASHPFPLATDVGISLSSTNANNGSDFVFYVPTVVEFSAGDVESCVNIVIINDDVPELSESFNLRILDGGYTIGDRGSADVEITDNDVVGVNFKQIEYVVSEDGGSVSVCVVASHPFPLATDVGISLSSTNANNGSDFVFYVPTVVEFSAGDVESCVNIVIIDDDVPELSESFNLRILDGGYTIGDRGSADVEITDNDVVGVNFKQIEYVVSEDGGSVSVCVVASHPFPLATDVGISLSSTNANNGSDFVFYVPTVVEFSAGDVESCVNIVIVDDDVPELSESFNLRILDGGYTIRGRGSADVEITDNDAVSVNFKQIKYVVSEDGGSVSVCVVASHPFTLETEVGISLSTINASNGCDFKFPLPTVVMFSAGEMEACVDIVIIDDDVPEFIEAFDVYLLGGDYIIGNRRTVGVEIIDNDAISVRFKNAVFFASEDARSVRVCLLSSWPFLVDTEVVLKPADRALQEATGGSFPPDQDVDYNNEPVVVRFVAGSSQSCVTIGIHDDSQPEITEAFEVFIMPSSAAKYTVRMPSRAEVYIADNDLVTVMFERSEYTINENEGPLVLTLVSSAPFTRDTIVSVVLRSGDAKIGEDFPSPTQLLVTFKAGLTRSNPISVPITDDKMFEDREKFYITIKPSPSLSYLPGSPSEVAINIQDNERNIGIEITDVIADCEDQSYTIHWDMSVPFDNVQCLLNGRNLGRCSSPLVIKETRLVEGPNRFIIRALKDGRPIGKANRNLWKLSVCGFNASMTDKEVMVTWAPPKTLQNESLTFKCFVNGEQLKKRQCMPGGTIVTTASLGPSGNRFIVITCVDDQPVGEEEFSLPDRPQSASKCEFSSLRRLTRKYIWPVFSVNFTWFEQGNIDFVRCSIDGGPSLPCSSPFEIPLENYCFKRHTIKVSGYCDRTEVDSLSGNFRAATGIPCDKNCSTLTISNTEATYSETDSTVRVTFDRTPDVPCRCMFGNTVIENCQSGEEFTGISFPRDTPRGKVAIFCTDPECGTKLMQPVYF